MKIVSNMADDIEIDVEGDFDIKLELNGGMAYDVNELPSKSANLLPEFIHPPWMLEQGWTLDGCMDEKSKATIEKMLQEEQYYLSGRNSSQNNCERSTKSPKCKPATTKRLWTKEEKRLFEQGLELFGRSWKKIAETIPDRTSLQVKNFAQKYFKSLSKQNETDTIPKSNEPEQHRNNLKNPLLSALAKVTTAQATIPTVTHNKDPPMILPKKPSLKTGCVSSTVTNDPIDSCATITPTLSDLSSLISDNNNDAAEEEGEIAEKNNESETEDVDIEGLDTEETNPVLKNRSASPNSVYIALLESSKRRKQKSESHSRTANTDYGPQPDAKSAQVEKGALDDGLKARTLDALPEEIFRNPETSPNQVESNSVSDSLAPLNNNPVPPSEKPQDTANVFYASGGSIFSYPIPTEERILEPNEITEEEKSLFPEFFEGRIAKTPDRFLKIRNYILECWKNCKPSYLNKTCVRPGLKNCGDVNYIGKIHAYLECTGAINIGCEQASYNQSPKVFSLSGKNETSVNNMQSQDNKMENVRSRRRRIRNADGFWVNEKQGRIIEPKVNPPSKPNVSKVVTSHKILEDPFRLIPCQTFQKGMEPFHLEIESSALIVMDVHAHLFQTEVVGLLGGECLANNIRIKMAVPCRSISTRIQCEMDAVSQAEASAVITEADQWVVGWYHSHPSFAANPSVRDVESQLKYQEWFARGGAKYVAFIVSPYTGKVNSEICCLTVEKLADSHSQYLPFQHKYQELNSELDAEYCLANIKQILSQEFCLFQNRVSMNEMIHPKSELTCLTKMINSISNYITSDHPEKANFLSLVKELFN